MGQCPNCLYTGTAIPHPIDGRESSGVQCFGVKKGSKTPAVDLALDTGAVRRASAMAREGATTPTAIDPDNPNGERPQSARRASWKNAKFRAQSKTSVPAGKVTAHSSVPEGSSDSRTGRTRRRGR